MNRHAHEDAAAALDAAETPEEEERKTSFLELFFDLVFVFAFTQVTALLLEDATAAGFLRATLVLALVWWAWSAYTWMTNAIDVDNVVTRLIVFAGMAAAFFMALAVPDAYEDEAAWFAVAYFVVRLLQPALYAWGVRHDRAQLGAVRKLAPWFLVAALVALVGGFVEPDLRAWVWLLSLAIDVVGTLTVARAGWKVSPSHFAERFLRPRPSGRSRAPPRRTGPPSPGTCSRTSTSRSCSGSSSTPSRRRRRSRIRRTRSRRQDAGRSGSGSRSSCSRSR